MRLWLKGNITIPPKPHTVGGLIRWARAVNRTLTELRDRKIAGAVSPSKGGGTKLPFHVSLVSTGDPPSYEVTVGWGYVIERIPGAGDALKMHEPANMWDTVDPTKLRKFAITEGQAVYIRCEVDEDGKIVSPGAGDAVSIVIEADEEESTHYIPKADTITMSGEAGFYLYKLAVLDAPVAPSTTPKIKKWLTGSHIDHFQELPAIQTAMSEGTGIGVIPKEWNDADKAYKLRAIQAGDGTTVVQEADTIKISADYIHQWKATKATATSINVLGGVFRSQAGFDQANVADVAGLAVAASGYAILTVTRDTASRVVAAAPIISYVSGEPAESDYSTQIIPLAKVTFAGGAITNILPLKFEELHVFEDLAVVNGEFRLADILIASRNIYELPPP